MSVTKLLFLLTFYFFSLSSHAAPVTVVLDAEVIFGDFAGEMATGTIIFEDSLISGVGDESINAADGLDVEFFVFGQMFTEDDDIDFDDKPSLDFLDGEIIAFDWVVSEIDGGILTDIDEPGVLDFSMFEVTQSIGSGGELLISGELFVNDFTVVPVPAAFPFFVLGLGIVSGFIRRLN